MYSDLSVAHDSRTSDSVRQKIEGLKRRYLLLCGRLESEMVDGWRRWSIFLQLSKVRKILFSFGVPHHHVAIIRGNHREWSARYYQLAQGIVCHFKDPRLISTLLEPRIEGLASAAKLLSTYQSWHDSERRIARCGYFTLQEDVLLQELKAISRVDCRIAGIEDFLVIVRLLRARDNAIACFLQFWKEFFAGDRIMTDLIVSVGSGLGQFEELLVQRMGVRILACDTEGRPSGLEKDSRIEFHTSSAEDFLKIFPNYSVGVLIIKDVLHHIPDTNRFLKLCQVKLKPGGRVFVIEPVYEDGDFDALSALRELDSTPYKLSFRSELGWEAEFERVGLSIWKAIKKAPGIIDNNDGFSRKAWLLKKQLT